MGYGYSLGIASASLGDTGGAPSATITVSTEPTLDGVGTIRAGETAAQVEGRMTQLGAATASDGGTVTRTVQFIVGGIALSGNTAFETGQAVTIRVRFFALGAASVPRTLGPVTVQALGNTTNIIAVPDGFDVLSLADRTPLVITVVPDGFDTVLET